ncbi:MAG: hypothetical protein P8Q54_15150 [Akkermansiaceae bacterium]|nr:hypothetical protein [Akkermansiaceae bacterium]
MLQLNTNQNKTMKMKSITKTTMPLAALAGIALLSQTSEAALSVGLVANYTFDVDASDATGNHDAAAMTNGATNPAATSGGQGKFGEAFQFTHTAQANAQWVEIPAAATSGLTQFTMSIWVNTTSATSNGATFSTLDTIWGTNNSGGSDFGINTWFGDAGYWHDLGAPGRRAFMTRLSSTPEPIADGAWHHLALVNDGSQAQMYVDGVLAGGGAERTEGLPVVFFVVGEKIVPAVLDELPEGRGAGAAGLVDGRHKECS